MNWAAGCGMTVPGVGPCGRSVITSHRVTSDATRVMLCSGLYPAKVCVGPENRGNDTTMSHRDADGLRDAEPPGLRNPRTPAPVEHGLRLRGGRRRRRAHASLESRSLRPDSAAPAGAGGCLDAGYP